MRTKTRTANPDMQELEKSAADLAESIGIRGVSKLIAIQGGRNNRVFRLRIGNTSYLLKSYFRHEKDLRDRLGAEFAFLSFAWARGLRMIPRPIVSDHSQSLGLYEFIEGRKLAASEITMDYVQRALDFYLSLNDSPYDHGAQKLSKASEACFSVCDHLNLVDYRIHRLLEIDFQNIPNEAHHFIHDGLFRGWTDLKNSVLENAQALGIDGDRQLSYENWVLSPSDFGFHNAILEDSGQIRFIDFEYAGWDDPAKMVCDFFCQPEVPVPLDYFPAFRDSVITKAAERENLRERIQLLMPVYRMKWCCIMLNDFHPEGNRRREFSNRTSRLERMAKQLRKARHYYNDWIEPCDI